MVPKVDIAARAEGVEDAESDLVLDVHAVGHVELLAPRMQDVNPSPRDLV